MRLAAGCSRQMADAGLGMLLAQLQQPVVQRFGGSADGLLRVVTECGVNEVQIGLAIGTIQADDQVKGMM